MLNTRAPKIRRKSSSAATKSQPSSPSTPGTDTAAPTESSPSPVTPASPASVSTPLAEASHPQDTSGNDTPDGTLTEMPIPGATPTASLCSKDSDNDSLFGEQSDKDAASPVAEMASPGATSAGNSCSDGSDNRSLFGEQSDKDGASVASVSGSDMGDAPSGLNKGEKRKSFDDVASDAVDCPAAKKIKMSDADSDAEPVVPPSPVSAPSPASALSVASATTPVSAPSPSPPSSSPPSSPHGNTDNSVSTLTATVENAKKRKASGTHSSSDGTPSAKKVKAKEPASSRSSSVDIDELLFPTKPASVTPPSAASTPPTTPTEPARKPTVRRRKPHVANPFRTDLRMGVRGTAAAGAGTVHRPQRKSPAAHPTTQAPVASPIKQDFAPGEQEALTKLLKTTAQNAESKIHSTVVDLSIDKAMQAALIRSDRSIGKGHSGPVRGVPEWRRDNPDWKEGSGLEERSSTATGWRKSVQSNYAGMSKGSKKILKVASKGENAARSMSSSTFSYRRGSEEAKGREMEKERVRREVERKQEEKAQREKQREEEKLRRQLDDLFEE